MRIAVTIAVHNEEKTIEKLIESLFSQTLLPDEIVFVDDGSKDRTVSLIEKYIPAEIPIRLLVQEQKGPAAARNLAWKESKADICVFTDGDCIPESTWLERLVKPLENPEVGGSGGTYKTLNKESLLARFIGLEISWRYRKVKGEIDCHGSYNLAVRRHLLEKVGGFNEDYPDASGEDFDLTYNISQYSILVYTPEAVVGHYHPQKLFPYLKNQVRRGYDRVKLYCDHPRKAKSDTYTPWYVKYQVAFSGLFLPSLVFLYPAVPPGPIIPLLLLLLLLMFTCVPFFYFFKRDMMVAFYSIPVQFLRGFAWMIGLMKGLLRFGFPGG